MRDDQGRFVPGASGNPGGRPRQTTELRDLIEPLLPTLIAALAEIACDPKQTGRTRFMAIKELLDRGIGCVPRAAALRQTLPPAEPPEPTAPSDPCKTPVLRSDPEPASLVIPANAGIHGPAPAQAGANGEDRADRLDSRWRGNDGSASQLDNASEPPASPAETPLRPAIAPGGPVRMPLHPEKTPVLRPGPGPARPTVSACKTALLKSSTALDTVLGCLPAAPGKTPVLRCR